MAENTAVPADLLENLFRFGLGELLVMHVHDDQVLLGHVVYEKGKLTLKDRSHAKDITPEQVAPCSEYGTVGAVCVAAGKQWESLTFYGLDHCQVKDDLSSTRTSLLGAARNQYGDTLLSFDGSIYRAYQLMLDSNIIPVIRMTAMETKREAQGLCVCDLRMASIPLSVIQNVHEAQRSFVERQLTLSVEDLHIDSDEFEQLFGTYLAAG